MGIHASDDAGQTGAAKTRCHVTAAKRQAVLSQPVDVWGLNDLVTHETIVGPGVVVGDDHDDIRPIVGVYREYSKTQQANRKKSGYSFQNEFSEEGKLRSPVTVTIVIHLVWVEQLDRRPADGVKSWKAEFKTGKTRSSRGMATSASFRQLLVNQLNHCQQGLPRGSRR